MSFSDDYLKPDEIAELTQDLSYRHILHEIKIGRLRSEKIGQLKAVSKIDFNRWVTKYNIKLKD